MKQEKILEKKLNEQQEARKLKAAEKKEKRNHRKAVTMGIAEDTKDKAAKKEWAEKRQKESDNNFWN